MDYLHDCLESLRANPPHHSYEVIIVDNASTDDTSKMLAKDFSDINLISTGSNRGFAAGNNIGAQQAKGEYLLFLNPDTQISENAIDSLISALNKRADVGAVGGRLLLGDGSVQPFMFGSDPRLGYLFKRALLLSLFKKYAHDWETTEVLDVDWVSGACMMVRTKAFQAVGGFDEKMFMYFEDNDLCRRLRDNGWKIIYYPHAEIVHFGGKSFIENDRVRKDAYFASLRYFYGKHFGRFANYLLPAFILFYRSLLEQRTANNIKAVR